MRIERWYWLIVFCIVSLGLHILAVKYGPHYALPEHNTPTAEIEVSLQPSPLTPAAKPAKKPGVTNHAPLTTHIVAARTNKRPAGTPKGVEKSIKPKSTAENRQVRVAKANFLPHPAPQPRPVVTRAEPQPKPVIHVPTASERAVARMAALRENNPNADVLPQRHRPAPQRFTAARDVQTPGGASPGIAAAPGRLPTADTLTDSASFGGAARANSSLLNRAPGTGSTTHDSVLGSDNPLAQNQPDERPGISPGSGGSPGAGKSLGSGRSLSALRGRPGTGPAATSSGTGAGHGTNSSRSAAETLVGTGPGGYGAGHGSAIGAGLTGDPGTGSGSGANPLSAGDSAQVSSNKPSRGTPFGSVAGLLGLAGPGPTRGDPFKQGGGGGKAPVHIVYVLDCSGSMRDGNKIGKAKEALKRALFELRPTDTFDIILFNRNVARLSQLMMPADGALLDEAARYVDDARLADGTNIQQAMETALSINGITHVFLMSDGEPNGGIMDFNELRRFIKFNNRENAHILTMGLCLGENYKGEPLMKGIADDNAGEYNYINLSKLH